MRANCLVFCRGGRSGNSGTLRVVTGHSRGQEATACPEIWFMGAPCTWAPDIGVWGIEEVCAITCAKMRFCLGVGAFLLGYPLPCAVAFVAGDPSSHLALELHPVGFPNSPNMRREVARVSAAAVSALGCPGRGLVEAASTRPPRDNSSDEGGRSEEAPWTL